MIQAQHMGDFSAMQNEEFRARISELQCELAEAKKQQDKSRGVTEEATTFARSLARRADERVAQVMAEQNAALASKSELDKIRAELQEKQDSLAARVALYKSEKDAAKAELQLTKSEADSAREELVKAASAKEKLANYELLEAEVAQERESAMREDELARQQQIGQYVSLMNENYDQQKRIDALEKALREVP